MFVLGGAQTDFAKRAPAEDGLFSLLESVTQSGLQDARLDPREIQSAHVGNFVGERFSGQGHLGGQLAAVDPGLDGIPIGRHEAACASGSIAVRAALAEIAAGYVDVALVVGLEQMRHVPGAEAAQHLGAALWAGREATEARFPWPAQFAAIADAYAERYDLSPAHLLAIAKKNLAHARRNPYAQTRDWTFEDRAFTCDDSLNPVVEGSVRKLDCSRVTDGAAALVLASPRYAARWAEQRGLAVGRLPRITGFGHRTTQMLLAPKLAARPEDGAPMFPHLAGAIRDAWRSADVEGVSDLDLVETHDCFTITEYLAYDHLGLTAPGEAWRAVEAGDTTFGGRLPVNPSGGLIGAGHPVGATGVRMVLDVARQVGGRAGDMQIDGARRGQTVNVGGSLTTVVSFVLEAGEA